MIAIVDDDDVVREAMKSLMRSLGYNASTFGSADEFLKSEQVSNTSCLVTDLQMPGLSGIDLQDWLIARGHRIPIIFITGHGDIPMSVKAMKAGAVEFLTKPFRDQDLLDAVNIGLARDRARRANEESLNALRARFAVLTPRERAILT